MQSNRLVGTAMIAALIAGLSGIALAVDAPSGTAAGSGAATTQPAPNGSNGGATTGDQSGGRYGAGMMGGRGHGPGMMQGYGPGMRGGDNAGPRGGGPGAMMRGYGPADDGRSTGGGDRSDARGGWWPGDGDGQGGMMRGYGNGPGMMGGYGPWMRAYASWMGPWMMGPWMMGPGMMGSGMMGPGMMGPGMMGPGMMAGCAPGFAGDAGRYHGAYHQAALDLSVQDVQGRFQRWLQWRHNPHLKLGSVKEVGPDTITADIVTQDNSLVRRFDVDRHTGQIVPTDE